MRKMISMLSAGVCVAALSVLGCTSHQISASGETKEQGAAPAAGLTLEEMRADADCLTRFASHLAHGLETEARTVRALPDDTESFEAVVIQLFRRGVIKDFNLKLLAGKSGTPLSDEECRQLKEGSGHVMPRDDACIFTGPKLVRVLQSSLKHPAEFGPSVVLTYKDAWRKKSEATGFVVLQAGSETAEVLTPLEFEATFHAAARVVYGEEPFKIVEPK